MAKIPHRLYLTEDQMPKQWYNLRADMKEKPDPLIHPGTHQPLPEEWSPPWRTELPRRIRRSA